MRLFEPSELAGRPQLHSANSSKFPASTQVRFSVARKCPSSSILFGYLKPIQVYRRIFPAKPHVLACIAPKQRKAVGKWQPGISRESPRLGPRTFRFLNQTHRIETWNDAGVPKLWLYNLHYFECPAPDLIRRWIEENPIGQGNGWEPYPTLVPHLQLDQRASVGESVGSSHSR